MYLIPTLYENLKLQLDGLHKGIVWVNGFNLGRYWLTCQFDNMYVPTDILKKENLIVVYEETNAVPDHIRLIYDQHYTGTYSFE